MTDTAEKDDLVERRQIADAYSDWAWEKEGSPVGLMLPNDAARAAFFAGARWAKANDITAAQLASMRDALTMKSRYGDPAIKTAVKCIKRWQENPATSFTPTDILHDFGEAMLTALEAVSALNASTGSAGISKESATPPASIEEIEQIIRIEFFSNPVAARHAAERVFNFLEARIFVRAKTLARQATTSGLPHREGQAVECDGGLRTGDPASHSEGK